MRKRMIQEVRHTPLPPEQDWLNIENLAAVEITSEDPAHPIESALIAGGGEGWRAAEPGTQTVRLLFDQPQRLRWIRVEFLEPDVERTQEYVLRWSPDRGQAFRDIVRQQWNFGPDATSETEDHRVDLTGVRVLELSIAPDIGAKRALATLARMRIA